MATVRPGFTTHNGKALHWTQTPNGRLKLIAMSKARAKDGGAVTVSAYSPTRKRQILRYGDEHQLSARKLGERYKVTASTIYYWRNQLNGAAPKGKRNGNGAIVKQENRQVTIHHAEADEQNKITYAVGECSGFLRIYAESIGVPAREFTRRVGELLLRKAYG